MLLIKYRIYLNLKYIYTCIIISVKLIPNEALLILRNSLKSQLRESHNYNTYHY